MFFFMGYRIASCDTPAQDSLDQVLKKVNVEVEERKREFKEKWDAKMEELWETVKERYISDPAKESFKLIEEIRGK
jgi:hypothetical protein